MTFNHLHRFIFTLVNIYNMSKNRIQYIYLHTGNKLVKKSFANTKKFMDELSILRKLKSSVFINYPIQISNMDKIMFFTYYPFDLFTIVNHKLLSVSEILTLYFQILLAVQHLHQMGIEHHDIKLENCLVDEHFKKIYLIDFEFATHSYQVHPENVGSGTPAYQPPESYFENTLCLPSFSKKDIWSLGIMYIIIKYDYFPIQKNTIDEYRNFIHQSKQTSIRNCFDLVPQQRVSIHTLVFNMDREINKKYSKTHEK
jgi:serine/threonine protein kinase